MLGDIASIEILPFPKRIAGAGAVSQDLTHFPISMRPSLNESQWAISQNLVLWGKCSTTAFAILPATPRTCVPGSEFRDSLRAVFLSLPVLEIGTNAMGVSGRSIPLGV